MSDGVPRNEKVTLEGNILTVENVNDGYTITVDYEKVKNVDACFVWSVSVPNIGILLKIRFT